MAEKIKYFVNEKKRVVVAVLEGDYIDLAACNLFEKNGIANLTNDVYFNPKNRMKNKYIGTARCHEDDEFDVEIGKELAKKRALVKYYRELCEKVTYIKYDLIESIDKVLTKPIRHYVNLKEDLNELEEEL